VALSRRRDDRRGEARRSRRSRTLRVTPLLRSPALPRPFHRPNRGRAAIALTPGNLIDLLINTQILNGIITPIILVFILILANRRSLLGDAANSPRFRIVATIAIAAVAALALFVTLDTVLGWFGGGWG
jgi:hypothetical protein